MNCRHFYCTFGTDWRLGKNIVPGEVATASEERKDNKYKAVWNKHKDFIDSIGFDHNGGWGKQALEVLKELFKNGDHWHSEWHRLYFRKMTVEQVSELLTDKNAELVLFSKEASTKQLK